MMLFCRRCLLLGLLLLCGNETVRAGDTVTYHARIKSILTRHCTPCHARGRIGPMPLTTYTEASAYGAMIARVTRDRRMPPWSAEEAGTQITRGHRLSDADVEALEAWVADGLREGKPSRVLVRPVPMPSTGTALKPTPSKAFADTSVRRFAMQQRYTLTGSHGDYGQVFVVPTGLEEDLWTDAIRFHPGNARIVQSVMVAVDTGGEGETLDLQTPEPGYPTFSAWNFQPAAPVWYTWMPDDAEQILPKGFLKRIPARSTLLFHVRYMAAPEITTAQSDSSWLEVHTAQRTPQTKEVTSRLVVHSGLLREPLRLGAGDRRQVLVNLPLESAMRIHSLMPFGQYACRSWEVSAVSADGEARTLLSIPDWNFYWRRRYALSQPFLLDAGTTLRALAYYDNTDANGALPILPPTLITAGEGKKREAFWLVAEVSE